MAGEEDVAPVEPSSELVAALTAASSVSKAPDGELDAALADLNGSTKTMAALRELFAKKEKTPVVVHYP